MYPWGEERTIHLLENTNGSNSCGMKAMCFGERTPVCSSVTIVSIVRWQHLWHRSEASTALGETATCFILIQITHAAWCEGQGLHLSVKQTTVEVRTGMAGLCVQRRIVCGNAVVTAIVRCSQGDNGAAPLSRSAEELGTGHRHERLWVHSGWPHVIPETMLLTFSSWSSVVPYLIPDTSIYLPF